MKKLALVMAIILIFAGFLLGCRQKPVMAEDFKLSEALEKLPPLKQGVAYSLLDSDFNYLSTLEVANWKGLSLEAGYSSKDKIVGVISYQVLRLKDYINLPILNLVEFNLGLYGGFGRISIDRDFGEWDAGISATLISVKF